MGKQCPESRQAKEHYIARQGQAGEECGKVSAYDRGLPDTGGSAPSSAASLPPSVVTLLQSVAEKDSKAAEALEGLLPDATSEELKSRQRQLNAVRKAKQKLDRKESSLAKKEAMMVRFLEETRQHVLSEKARHKAEVETLKQEIIDAREALERAKNGQQEEDDCMGKAEDDLDSLLGQDHDLMLQKENQDLKEQIQRMTFAHREQQTQMYDMQARMEEFMKTFADRKNEVVKPELAIAMGVFNGTPVDLEAMDTAPTTPSRTHPALQPFRGGGRNSNRPSPYGTDRAKGEEPKPSTTWSWEALKTILVFKGLPWRMTQFWRWMGSLIGMSTFHELHGHQLWLTPLRHGEVAAAKFVGYMGEMWRLRSWCGLPMISPLTSEVEGRRHSYMKMSRGLEVYYSRLRLHVLSAGCIQFWEGLPLTGLMTKLLTGFGTIHSGS